MLPHFFVKAAILLGVAKQAFLKGELFSLVKSSPSGLCPLPLQKHAWSRKTLRRCLKLHSLLKKRDKTFIENFVFLITNRNKNYF